MGNRGGSGALTAVVFLLLSCDVLPNPSTNLCQVVPGPAGLNGRDGRDGKDGTPGATGIQGPLGEAGKPGVRGDPGPPGKHGPPGIKGDLGQKGDTGAQGTPGDTGKQGLRGDPGIPGSKGDRGQQGQKGDPDTHVMAKITSLEERISVLQRHLSTLEREVKISNTITRAGDKSYVTNGREGDYEAARKACEAAGGTLPMPLNREEDAAIVQMVKMKDKSVFLGINDQREEGVFKLLNGRHITYANWNAGEPNNADNEDCAEITTTGKWNDKQCSVAGLIVCEFEVLSH